jgi:hypothetical protein
MNSHKAECYSSAANSNRNGTQHKSHTTTASKHTHSNRLDSPSFVRVSPYIGSAARESAAAVVTTTTAVIALVLLLAAAVASERLVYTSHVDVLVCSLSLLSSLASVSAGLAL